MTCIHKANILQSRHLRHPYSVNLEGRLTYTSYMALLLLELSNIPPQLLDRAPKTPCLLPRENAPDQERNPAQCARQTAADR